MKSDPSSSIWIFTWTIFLIMFFVLVWACDDLRVLIFINGMLALWYIVLILFDFYYDRVGITTLLCVLILIILLALIYNWSRELLHAHRLLNEVLSSKRSS